MNRSRTVFFVALLGCAGCVTDLRIAGLRRDYLADLGHGRLAEAGVTETKIRELAAGAYGALSPETVELGLALAETRARAGDVDGAITTVNAIVAEAKTAPPLLLPALLARGRIEANAAQWKDAEATADRASQACDLAATEARQACWPPARMQIAALYREAGATRKWAAEFLRAYSADSPASERDNSVSTTTALGRGFAENGAYGEALWYLQRCIDQFSDGDAAVNNAGFIGAASMDDAERSSPSGDVEIVVLDGAHTFHSQAPPCLDDLIAVRRRTGGEVEAARWSAWRRELWARGPDLEQELIRKLRFADNTWHADVLTSSYANTLAFYYTGKNRMSDAARVFAEGIAFLDRGVASDARLEEDFPAWLYADELLGLGRACEAAGRPGDAEAAYRRAIDVVSHHLHPGHAWRLDALAGLARALLQMGRAPESIDAWRRYLAVAETVRGRNHADYAFGLGGLADALDAEGHSRDAAAARRESRATLAAFTARIASAPGLPLPASLLSPASPANQAVNRSVRFPVPVP